MAERILDHIRGPQDLKGLSLKEMEQLAQEVREELINTVTRVGGHFGSNLGVVELTIVLHALFDSPKDKIIWDVGHQAYPHKMLTGRRERMGTIRQKGGLCGFCVRSESPHDIFGAGHGGTSISAALGFAKARDLLGRREHVVAVIGDGSFTAGMALEALDHAGELGTDLLIILNDNGMGISPNIGALHRYLVKLRSDPHYRKAKELFEEFMHFMPLGDAMVDALERVKGSIKQFFQPRVIFEDLGCTYLGPVDGHNIADLRDILENAKQLKGPIVVHVVTVKGKGMPEAEQNPVGYHAIKAVGAPGGKKLPSYTDVFVETLIELARRDERIVAVTAAMLEGTGLVKFQKEFPHRCFDVAMAEQHAVTFCAGMALGGLRPVAAIYSTFLQRAFDQIVHDVCIQNIPVVFAIDRAGLVGNDGPTHQGVFDLSYLRCLPHMVIMAPKDENELRHMLKTALEYTDGPIAVRYPRDTVLGLEPPERLECLPIGKGELLREGRHVALVAIGTMVQNALQAAELLAAEGIEAAVVNARFVKPLDKELIRQVAEATGAVVTIEDNVRMGGFGSGVLEFLSEAGLYSVRTLVLGVPDRFIEHATREEQLEECGLDPRSIAQRVKDWLGLPARVPLRAVP